MRRRASTNPKPYRLPSVEERFGIRPTQPEDNLVENFVESIPQVKQSSSDTPVQEKPVEEAPKPRRSRATTTKSTDPKPKKSTRSRKAKNE